MSSVTPSREEIIAQRKLLAKTIITKAVFPETTNHHNTLFGGTAMQWMDEVSFITATRFARCSIVTVSSDKIDFNHPVPAGTVVELTAEVVHVGRSSLKVEVNMLVESMYADGQENAITGQFTFVAIDENMKPTSIVPETFEVDKAEL
jgi:acyl-CoA hydrolase